MPGNLFVSLVFLTLLSSVSPALGAQSWQLGGDARVGYAASWNDQRDGSDSSADNARLRLRLRAATALGPSWRFNAGVGGSYASDQDGFDFYIRRARPNRTGVNPGDSTVDVLNVLYRTDDGTTGLRIGRFASSFTLPIVPSKSLIRNDSSNFGLGWTDGVWLDTSLSPTWRLHAIGQLNSRTGTGNTARVPLDFAESRSRRSLFAALEARRPLGVLSTRMLSAVWIPDGLAEAGPDQPDRKDFLGLSAQLAATWPLASEGPRFVVAGELAHAVNTPTRGAMGLPGEGSVGGNAWQASLNLFDWRPGHSIGGVYGQLQPGWLISNDYRENDRLAELRYAWKPQGNLALDFRYRWRREIEPLAEAQRRRQNRDIYLRLTYRFQNSR